MPPFDQRWPLCDAVQLACILEVAAPKLGNVHPSAQFSDMHFCHFATSAIAVRKAFEDASQTVGQVVRSAALATSKQIGCNTNLGTLLLFAPLAKAWQPHFVDAVTWQQSLKQLLENLTPKDSEQVYEAIRTAQPGGLGQREQGDVAKQAPPDLIDAMRQVADIDAVARQYTNCFADIFGRLLPWLDAELASARDPLDAICRLQIRWLAYEPDGLIIRKVGESVAHEVQRRAQDVYRQLTLAPAAVCDIPATGELDAFLRADGHRRNPGTTADLIAATLLVRLLLGAPPVDPHSIL